MWNPLLARFALCALLALAAASDPVTNGLRGRGDWLLIVAVVLSISITIVAKKNWVSAQNARNFYGAAWAVIGLAIVFNLGAGSSTDVPFVLRFAVLAFVLAFFSALGRMNYSFVAPETAEERARP